MNTPPPPAEDPQLAHAMRIIKKMLSRSDHKIIDISAERCDSKSVTVRVQQERWLHRRSFLVTFYAHGHRIQGGF